METVAYNDLRGFIEEAKKVSEWRDVEGADWDREIGAIVEAAAELIPQAPMLIFNNIKGYPSGYRVLSLPYASYKRVAIALGLPTDIPKLELIRLAARKVKNAQPLAPEEVDSSPVMENVFTGDDVDLFRLPALRFHEHDGGRYLGTADSLVNQDPESGYINSGTYRCMRYWAQGKSCPVVATFGQNPLVFMTSYSKLPWGRSEHDMVGGLMGRPMEYIRGPITGLRIPASAEIAIEGEVPPPSEEAREEGPFGEWPGYYSGGTIGTGIDQPVIRVKALYHRNDPILEDAAPMWPGAIKMDLPLSSGVLWDQLEAAGIQDIVGVYSHTSFMVVIAIRQRFAGTPSRQAWPL